ncbi:hypothetical protein HY489_04315 [Candidatus Woesearchaeota archaeon]|nr:hypothetical protein [Candidatus Woesearchaeota archaeon]
MHDNESGSEAEISAVVNGRSKIERLDDMFKAIGRDYVVLREGSKLRLGFAAHVEYFPGHSLSDDPSLEYDEERAHMIFTERVDGESGAYWLVRYAVHADQIVEKRKSTKKKPRKVSLQQALQAIVPYPKSSVRTELFAGAWAQNEEEDVVQREIKAHDVGKLYAFLRAHIDSNEHYREWKSERAQ